MDEYFLPRLDQLNHGLVFGRIEPNTISIWIFFPDIGLVDTINMSPEKNNYIGMCHTATEKSRLIFDYLIINNVVQISRTVQTSFPYLGEHYYIHYVKLTKSSLLQLL